jgi:hypothetical protein
MEDCLRDNMIIRLSVKKGLIMPHQIVTATTFARNLSDLLNQVRYQGITLDVKRGSEIVAYVTPPEVCSGYPIAELDNLMATLPRLSSEDTSAFQHDIATALGALRADVDPWDA